jgi:hypothetical protein
MDRKEENKNKNNCIQKRNGTLLRSQPKLRSTIHSGNYHYIHCSMGSVQK